MRKMKAIVLVGPKQLEIREVHTAPLKDYQIRIKIHSSSICGSDIKNFNNPVIVPQILGHEFAGVVTEILPQSKKYAQVGDRVTAFPMISCLKCKTCQKGIYRDCEKKESIGFNLPGSFAESITIDSRFVIKLHENISYQDGALIEHLACGYRIAQEIIQLNISTNKHILIIGDGPIALSNVQSLKVFGYHNITLVGKEELRKTVATKIGVKNVIDYKLLPTKIDPIDICILSAMGDNTLEQFIDHLSSDAIFFPQTRVENKKVQKKLLKLKWGRAFAYMFEDFYKVMKLINEHQIVTSLLVTKKINLNDKSAIEDILMRKDKQIKVILTN